jgi:hypothetical protein
VNQYKPTAAQLAAAENTIGTGLPSTDKHAYEIQLQDHLAGEDEAMDAGAPLQTQPFRMNATRAAKALRAKAGVGPGGASARQVSALKKKRFDSVFKALGSASAKESN